MREKENSKNIYLLGGSSLFNDIGSEMITPVFPFLIIALGGSGGAVGLLSGLRTGLEGLVKIFGGWFSDRLGKRKPFIYFGYFLSIIFKFLLALAKSWQHIVAVASLERFGKLRDAPRDAIIATSAKKRGKSFGIHQAMDTTGGVIGALLVLLLFWKFGFGFKSIIIIAASISILSLFPLLFVKEQKTKPIKKSLYSGVKDLSKKLKFFILIAGVFALADFGLYLFLILRAKQATGSFVAPLALYVLFNVVYAGFAVPFGVLSDKIGRKKVILFGYLLFIITAISFIYLSSLVYLIILFTLYGLVYAIVKSNQIAFVSDMSGKMKGTALGLYHTVIGLTSIPAGLIAGLLWNISYTIMFGYLAIMAAIAFILLSSVKEK